MISYQQELLGPKRKKDLPVKGAAAKVISVGTLLLISKRRITKGEFFLTADHIAPGEKHWVNLDLRGRKLTARVNGIVQELDASQMSDTLVILPLNQEVIN